MASPGHPFLPGTRRLAPSVCRRKDARRHRLQFSTFDSGSDRNCDRFCAGVAAGASDAVPGRSTIEWLAFFLPTLPLTLGWILLLDRNYGLINQAFRWLPFVHQSPFSIYSAAGIIWVHLTLTTVPVMTILLMPALRQFDAAIEESSLVCGAGPLATLRRITYPLLSRRFSPLSSPA